MSPKKPDILYLDRFFEVRANNRGEIELKLGILPTGAQVWAVCYMLLELNVGGYRRVF